ncbi:DUF551 domain-containing protein [Citrobacter freundii]|uniref:DUF551 domain-containing protein n=1 Tax=Enterobacteriaceae TaxID=543 RepID=UPI00131F9A06|nr:DUF551 domain-containing protein [Citrobacter freundii]MDV0677381.1 DUF551 domain-containing protein [Citrobacter freundii]MDV0858735.1 DUF551 domain-containing protein [Citrobacter freundii]MDV1798511.1 DUF551 domain-containing protein [Citrobacter freundii]MDV1850425.1 DUF551 domain-containing protein [Citrobacter freundii]MEB0365888.1 DUF551 domain-containing protein [Citrobacter freundii]
MTTNHPAHGPVSLDRLHQIRETLSKAAAQSDGGNLGYAMADAVKVIDGVIASFGAEPVGTFRKGPCGYYPSFHEDAVPLYAAPPVPVSVPDAMEMDDDFDSSFEHGKAVGWNAYRAAMLQGAEPVTTDYKLPFDQWLSQQTGTIDVECGCVMTEVFFHWLRVAYEAGKSPVIPDGWVACSERMPEKDDFVYIWPRPDFGVELHVAQYGKFDKRDAGWYAQVYEQNFGIEYHPITVTHWMPLPAAPQQEVK